MSDQQVTLSLDMPLEKAMSMCANAHPETSSGDAEPNTVNVPYDLKNSTHEAFQWVQPLVEKHYHTYYQKYWEKPDSFKIAFELLQKLFERKMVKEPKTVREFIELVNIFSEEIEARI